MFKSLICISISCAIPSHSQAFFAFWKSSSSGSVNQWTSSNIATVDNKESHTAVWTGTEMIVWGSTIATNVGGRYNPTTDTWTATSIGTNVPAARSSQTAVWATSTSEMIIWGGLDVTYAALDTGGRYNPTTDIWTATSTGANVPAARSGHTAVWATTTSEMIIWGGGGLNTGGKYNPSTDTWTATSVGANVPSGRDLHTAIWTGTQMIIWGGYDPAITNTGGKYTPGTDSWVATSTGTNVPGARMGHTAVWTGTEMIVWGGYDTGRVKTGGKYTPGADSWLATKASGGGSTGCPAIRDGHTAVWTGTEMIIWGGYSGTAAINSGSKYTPGTDSWLATSATNVPSIRQHHTAIWTGTEMIVWGGNGGAAALNSGGRYTPGTDVWVSTSTGTAPSSRTFPTMVWTGTEAIVWGGYSASSDVNTGAKYNPTTDTWTATSVGTNVPSARESHTAVWSTTTSEMIVWGGFSGAAVNTGGKYSPSGDSWTATSVGANVPAIRGYHTAVWTGTEMIIWGGYNGTVYLNTGGKYAPGANTWASTSVGANVPAIRSGHTAVWTGTEMIVWGGLDNGGTPINTGGKYTPGTDAWLTTSVGTNVPNGRQYHTAVWTGAEMIVWGGLDNGGTPINTGGKYTPGTDAWLTTSVGANVPTGRQYHVAVWSTTTSEMIVWGGYESAYDVNTGGRYKPTTDSWAITSTGTGVPTVREKSVAVWNGTKMIVYAGVNSGTSMVSKDISLYTP